MDSRPRTRRATLLALAVLAGCLFPADPTPINGQSFAEFFETATGIPDGWTIASGEWNTTANSTAHSGMRVLEGSLNDSGSYALVLADGRGTFAGLKLSVQTRFRPEAREAVAGIVVHAEDPLNYVVARWGPALGGVGFLRFEEGQPVEHRERKDYELPFDTWISLSVEVAGGTVLILIDDEKVVAMTDRTITVGHVGLWLEGQGSAQFDSFNVERL